MRNAFSDALVAAAVADPRVLLLTGDHGYALFDQFRKKCPKQYINCGVAEQNMVGVAAGLAKVGFKPIVYGLAAFVPIRVLEQIKIDVCYENLPVIFIGDGAGLVYSHLGTSHQSTEDIACTRSITNLVVLSPADRFEMMAAIKFAINANSPIYLRMGKSDCGDVHQATLALREGEMLQLRIGQGNVAIFATGSMVTTALKITQNNIDADVWSVPIIKPLSAIRLHVVTRNIKKIITIEEHSVMGGLGSVITEFMNSGSRYVPVCRIGIENKFLKICGSWEYLLEQHDLGINHIMKKIERFIAS